jgi:glycosyltransferase involved in cell wall biosynthesis
LARVLHIAESIRGGCGTYLNELVPRQIAEVGTEKIRVLVPDRHRSQIPEVADSSVETFHRPGRMLGLIFFAVGLIAVMRAFRPQLVHAHSTFAGAIVRVLSMFTTRTPPIVYCPHGWVFDTTDRPAIKAAMQTAERFLSRWCAAVVAISQSEKSVAEAIGIPGDKVVLIRNGLSTAAPVVRAANWDDSRLRILFVGRLDRQKGIDVLLEAIQPLQHQTAVRVVGESVLSKSASRVDSPNVEYLGWLDQKSITSQMMACDVVVMPSRWEGFGLVAIEAMRLAKPVIASRVGGLVEIVVDGVTGRLVPIEDIAALRDALLADSEADRRRMGAAGRERFLDRFSIDRTHAQLISLYGSIGDSQHSLLEDPSGSGNRDERPNAS